MRGSLLRASATYCIGVAERSRSGEAKLNPLPKGIFWLKDLAVRWFEQLKSEAKRTKREECNDFNKKKRSWDEDGVV